MDRGIQANGLAHQARHEEMRRRSKALFGNRDRLAVIAGVSQTDQAVCAADLEKRLGLANNRVRAQLLALAEAGLLIAMPKTPTERTQWYQRVSSPVWEMCDALYEDWSGSSHTDD